MGKASASDARGPGFEPLWLVQRSRWESRPLSLVGNGAGAVTHPIDRKGTVFPRGTGRFLVKKGVHIASFRCLSEERLSFAHEPLLSSLERSWCKHRSQAQVGSTRGVASSTWSSVDEHKNGDEAK